MPDNITSADIRQPKYQSPAGTTLIKRIMFKTVRRTHTNSDHSETGKIL